MTGSLQNYVTLLWTSRLPGLDGAAAQSAAYRGITQRRVNEAKYHFVHVFDEGIALEHD